MKNLALVVLLSALLANNLCANVEVIFATTGPLSDVGLANDTVGYMFGFDLSPSGDWWTATAESDDGLDLFQVRGSGALATDVIWQEGDVLPNGLGTVVGPNTSLERPSAISDSGHVSSIARLRQNGLIQGDLLLDYNTSLEVVAAPNQLIQAFPESTYGTDLHSPNVVTNGSAAFVADNILGAGVTAENDLLTLTNNGATFAGQRKGITDYLDSPLQRIDEGQYFTNTDGTSFIFSGDTTAAIDVDDIVVVGAVMSAGTVVLQESVTPVALPSGIETFDAASRTYLADNDDWYVAGDTTAGTEFLMRNGQVLAAESDVAPNGFQYVNEPIAFTADAQGNYAWVWQTDNPDPDRDTILVYNGNRVLLTEGDIFDFDQDGDGTSEPALIEHLTIESNSLGLGDGHAYLMSEVDEPGTTVFIGWSFIRVPTAASCDFDANGACEIADLNRLLAEGPIQDGVGVIPGVNDALDLNGDGLIDLLDRDLWLAEAASENGFASAYKLGDANLDGVVDGLDFIAWNENRFAASLEWDAGDFNSDGIIDGLDFIEWNANRFTSSALQVPEPRTQIMLCIVGLLLMTANRSGGWNNLAEPDSENGFTV